MPDLLAIAASHCWYRWTKKIATVIQSFVRVGLSVTYQLNKPGVGRSKRYQPIGIYIG